MFSLVKIITQRLLRQTHERATLILIHRHTSLRDAAALHSPLGAVGVAWMTLVVGLGVLEDETVGALQPVGAFLHTVRSIFEVTTIDTLVRALREGEGEYRRLGRDSGQRVSEEEEVEGRVKQLARWKGIAERERDRCVMGKKVWEENKVKWD